MTIDWKGECPDCKLTLYFRVVSRKRRDTMGRPVIFCPVCWRYIPVTHSLIYGLDRKLNQITDS